MGQKQIKQSRQGRDREETKDHQASCGTSDKHRRSNVGSFSDPIVAPRSAPTSSGASGHKQTKQSTQGRDGEEAKDHQASCGTSDKHRRSNVGSFSHPIIAPRSAPTSSGASASDDSSSGLFIQGACIAGISLLLTYLGDVVFRNILTIASPLVKYQNPIVMALILGLLLHPTTDRVQDSLSNRRSLAWIDGWCDRYGPGKRALGSALVVWALLAVVFLVLGFLSIGLVLEGASAVHEVAYLPAKAESLWTEYIVDGGALERFPVLDWFRENAVVTMDSVVAMVKPQIDAAKEDASRAMDAVEEAASEFKDILESHGIETSSLPDASALISGQMSVVQEFIGTLLGMLWSTCKSMVSSPEQAWAALQDIRDQFGDQLVEIKTKVEETTWVASGVASYGTDAAGAAISFLRFFAGTFGSIIAYVWRSFLSAVLFVIILFKLLQAERSWLEVAFASFLPGVVPIESQEIMVRHVQVFSTSLLTSLGVKFALMYAATYGTWVLFHVPFPYTMSFLHALVHTLTPLGTTGRGIITLLFSIYLMYKFQNSKADDLSHWSFQCAQSLSDLLVGAVGLLAEDGRFASFATWLTSPGFIAASAFSVAAISAQVWAETAAEWYAPEMPWTKYVTFGGALLTVASWLAQDDDEKGSVGADCTANDGGSSLIVSPWALAASLVLFAFARLNPSATRAALRGTRDCLQ